MTDLPAVPVIAAFGDSLFAGWGLAPGQDVPSLLARVLGEEGRTVSIENHGVSGDTAENGLHRLGRVRALRADVALVEFGANDFYQGVDPAYMEEQLAAIITALQADDTTVILVGIRCLAEYTGAEYAARFEGVHGRLARRFALPLVPDILAAYLHVPSMVLPDGIHPNATGTEAIARLLLPSVRDALDTRNGLDGSARCE